VPVLPEAQPCGGQEEGSRAGQGCLGHRRICPRTDLTKSNIKMEDTTALGSISMQASTLQNFETMLPFGKPLWF